MCAAGSGQPMNKRATERVRRTSTPEDDMTSITCPFSLARSLVTKAPLAAVALLTLPGCFFYADQDREPPAPVRGDISFDWSFNGEPDCGFAGVREIDVTVADSGGNPMFNTTELCVGGGLTLLDFLPGDYIIFVDAYGSRDERLYAGDADVFVNAGEENYAGVIDLFVAEAQGSAAPLPPQSYVREGALAMYWSFIYPTDESAVTACDYAGVVDVDVYVDPLFSGGESFAATFDCRDSGVLVDALVEGPYALRISAYGRYDGAAVLLFDSGDLEVTIGAGTTTDLGDVDLPRVDGNFSDLDVAWSSPYGSCSQLGIYDVYVEITRDGALDDSFVVDCNVLHLLRTTFVPGEYTVTASGEGFDDDYFAAAYTDVAPGYLAPVNLELLPLS